MMSTFNNSWWRLQHRTRSEDKDSLLQCVGHLEGQDMLVTLEEGYDVISTGVSEKFPISNAENGAYWIQFFPPSFLIISMFSQGRTVCRCMRKLIPVWSQGSNAIIPIPWVWVAANQLAWDQIIQLKNPDPWNDPLATNRHRQLVLLTMKA